MNTFKQFFALLAFVFVTQAAFSQENFKRWAIELGGGATYPNMDINSQINPFGQAGIRFNLSPYLSLKGDFGMGVISGGEDDFNREFTNEYMRYSLKGYFNVGKMAHMKSSGVNILFNVGFGRVHTEITDGQYLTYDGFVDGEIPIAQRDFTSPNETYSSQDFVTSFGGLFQFKLSNSLALNLGGTYYMSNTDLMDGYSADALGNKYEDRYATAHLGLSIYFGGGDKHGDWVSPTGNTEELKKNAQSNQKAIKKMNNSMDDADGDGVIDAIDEDNATKEGVRVTTKGVPMDTDYDEVPDYLDDCPVTKGNKENNGCPGVKDSAAMKADTAMKAGKGKQGGRGAGKDGDAGRGGKGTGGEGGAGTGADAEGKKKDLTKGADYPRREYSEEEVKNYPVVTLKSTRDAKGESIFYIIGGSFNVKTNAIDFNKYLQSEGFDSQILFVKERNLFRVTFQKFNNEGEARNKLEEIREKFNPEAWLFLQ